MQTSNAKNRNPLLLLLSFSAVYISAVKITRIFCYRTGSYTSLRSASYVGCQRDTAHICCCAPCCRGATAAKRRAAIDRCPASRALSSKLAAAACERWDGMTERRMPDRYVNPPRHTIRTVAIKGVTGRAFQFAIRNRFDSLCESIRIDSFCKIIRPFDSLVVMQFIYCIVSAK